MHCIGKHNILSKSAIQHLIEVLITKLYNNIYNFGLTYYMAEHTLNQPARQCFHFRKVVQLHLWVLFGNYSHAKSRKGVSKDQAWLKPCSPTSRLWYVFVMSKMLSLVLALPYNCTASVSYDLCYVITLLGMFPVFRQFLVCSQPRRIYSLTSFIHRQKWTDEEMKNRGDKRVLPTLMFHFAWYCVRD